MKAFLYYPLYLFIFWYKNVLGEVFQFFLEFNRYTASLLSLPLLLKTFFKPLKNEYRQGLVLFSIVMGIIIKVTLLSIIIPFILFLLFVEVMVGLFLIILPLGLLVLLIFGKGIIG